jgi:hypothetical protein
VELGGIAVPVLSADAETVVPAPQPLTLVVRPHAFRIDGHVLRDGAARRLDTYRVICRNDQGHTLAVLVTDDDGRFSVNVKPDGEYAFSLFGDRGETATAEHVKAGARVDLRLRPPGTLRGTVRGAPRAFRVSASYIEDEVFFATGGAWELRDVPAGKHTVDVTALGLAARAEITLAPGETRTLDLTLAPVPVPEDGGAP